MATKKDRKSKISQAVGYTNNYSVLRMDGLSGANQPHEHCSYFVIDLKHDPYAKEALLAYAAECKSTNPKLYVDVLNLIDTIRYEELSGDAQ